LGGQTNREGGRRYQTKTNSLKKREISTCGRERVNKKDKSQKDLGNNWVKGQSL